MSEQKTVLITGANSGLGLATALEFSMRGYRTVGTVRSEAKGSVVKEAAEEQGLDIATVLLDVVDAERCAEVVAAVEPDILVNNAGYMLYSAIEEVDDSAARDLLETMVIAPARLARLCLPAMRERGWGRIIQISSLSARASFPLMGWYQASKQALEGVSDALRLEVAGSGVSVVLIEPGVFRSVLSEEFSAPQRSEDSLYAHAYEQSRKMFTNFERFMTETATVAKVVVRAAEARAPRARYPVGLDAQLSVLTGPFTPDALRDFAIRRTTGLG
jgi:NAD(P)-dependent dehydrogenase (short-subunit alcohol dehydrogenase family)